MAIILISFRLFKVILLNRFRPVKLPSQQVYWVDSMLFCCLTMCPLYIHSLIRFSRSISHSTLIQAIDHIAENIVFIFYNNPGRDRIEVDRWKFQLPRLSGNSMMKEGNIRTIVGRCSLGFPVIVVWASFA